MMVGPRCAVPAVRERHRGRAIYEFRDAVGGLFGNNDDAVGSGTL